MILHPAPQSIQACGAHLTYSMKRSKISISEVKKGDIYYEDSSYI